MRNIESMSAGAGNRAHRRPPATQRAARDWLVAALDRPRFEVLPTPGAAELVARHLPAGRTVTVTASPARGLEPTLDLAVELAAVGYDAVPHLAARMVVDTAHLTDVVTRLRLAGITRVFVPSGDAAQVGSYADAVDLLRDLTQLDHRFQSVGITAYPESHASISDEQTIRSMGDKQHHATELVSNLAFDPGVVEAWLGHLRARGVTLPLWLGVPGAVETTKLLRIAARIGVADSTRFLRKHRRTVARLASPGTSGTEAFLRDLGPALARPAAGVAGLHVFTFNQVAETEAWRSELLARLLDEDAAFPAVSPGTHLETPPPAPAAPAAPAPPPAPPPPGAHPGDPS